MYINNANKGAYIEKLIDNSADFYLMNKILLIQKKYVPFLFKELKNQKIYGSIKKSTTDYYAVYKGRYFDFEVKQTQKNYFLLNQIKKHQFKHLKKVFLFGGYSFLLIHFFIEDEIFIINYNELKELKSKVSLKQCQKDFISIKVIFPGIIDFQTLFENLILLKELKK